jgi:hypothetical protein
MWYVCDHTTPCNKRNTVTSTRNYDIANRIITWISKSPVQVFGYVMGYECRLKGGGGVQNEL